MGYQPKKTSRSRDTSDRYTSGQAHRWNNTHEGISRQGLGEVDARVRATPTMRAALRKLSLLMDQLTRQWMNQRMILEDDNEWRTRVNDREIMQRRERDWKWEMRWWKRDDGEELSSRALNTRPLRLGQELKLFQLKSMDCCYASLLVVSMATTFSIAMAIMTYACGHPIDYFIQSHEIWSHDGDYKDAVLHVNLIFLILRIYGLVLWWLDVWIVLPFAQWWPVIWSLCTLWSMRLVEPALFGRLIV